MQGALVSAADGQSLQWRLTSGQEIDLATGLIAGIRLAAGAAPRATRRLRPWKCATATESGANFFRSIRTRSHAPCTTGRSARWTGTPSCSCCPMRQFEIWDGARTPAGAPVWTAATSREALERSAVEQWMYLDGSYLIKLNGNAEQVSEQSGLLLASPKDVLPDRFLFAFDATDYLGRRAGLCHLRGERRERSGPWPSPTATVRWASISPIPRISIGLKTGSYP